MGIDFAGASHSALGYVELLRCAGLYFKRQICRLIASPVAAMPNVRQPRRGNPALRLVQVAPTQTRRDDEATWGVACVLACWAFDAFRASGVIFENAETVLDEDRIEAYRVLVIRGRWSGSQAACRAGDSSESTLNPSSPIASSGTPRALALFFSRFSTA